MINFGFYFKPPSKVVLIVSFYVIGPIVDKGEETNNGGVLLLLRESRGTEIIYRCNILKRGSPSKPNRLPVVRFYTTSLTLNSV